MYNTWILIPNRLTIFHFYSSVNYKVYKIFSGLDFTIIIKPVRFPLPKDLFHFQNLLDVYCIHCACGLSYTGQTKKFSKFMLKYIWCTSLKEISKCAVFDHPWSADHVSVRQCFLCKKCFSICFLSILVLLLSSYLPFHKF